jgi:hypothetical protein
MTEGIKITAMSRTARTPNKGGTRIVAFFDADIPSFAMARLRACAQGGRRVDRVDAQTARGPTKARLRDTRLQPAMTEAALAVYRHLGGEVGLEQHAAQAASLRRAPARVSS